MSEVHETRRLGPQEMILSSPGHSVIQIGISRRKLLKPNQLAGTFVRNACFLGLQVHSRTQKMATPPSLRSCIMLEHVTLKPTLPFLGTVTPGTV